MQENRIDSVNEKKAKEVFDLVTINECREMTFERFKSALHWYIGSMDFKSLYFKSISHKKLNFFQRLPEFAKYLYYWIFGILTGLLITLFT